MKRKPDDEILNEGLIDQALAAEEEEIKSRKFKYGTLATVFTIIFIIAIVLVNLWAFHTCAADLAQMF